jgi:hypothetical protein
MIKFTPSTTDDLQQLQEWIANDPYHFHQGQPEWWLSEAAGSLFAFCMVDDKGPLTYVRLDVEGEYVRIHTQFAPKELVSHRRLIVGMLQAVSSLIVMYRDMGAKGLVFNSISPTLIAFMSKRFDFKSVGNDDYRLDFEGK